MSTLDDEIAPLDDPSEASVEYRKQLTKSLLYKVIQKTSSYLSFILHIYLDINLEIPHYFTFNPDVLGSTG